MHKYRVIISPRAAQDLADAHEFISRESPRNASAVASRILETIDALRAVPHRTKTAFGKRADGQSLRQVPVAPYVIYFKVYDADKVVEIVHIRHGARQTPSPRDLQR